MSFATPNRSQGPLTHSCYPHTNPTNRRTHIEGSEQRQRVCLHMSLEGMFTVSWDFPSVEPPDYLRQLNPEIYEQECQRMRQRFDEAVQLAEQAFTEELSQLVGHLTERISGQTDGKPKIFRDSIVTNLTEFFERFRSLNIRSNEQLDQLVGQCQDVVQGVEPQLLRDNQELRQTVAQELTQVQNVLDDLLVDRPRRNILRRPR